MDKFSSKKLAKHRILVGAGGTITAFSAISSLRRNWGNDVFIVSMDINPEHLVTSSLISDKFEKVPFCSEKEFEKVLLKIIEEQDIGTYFPLLPDEIDLAFKLKSSGKIRQDLEILPSSAIAAEYCADKWKLFNLIDSQKINCPRTNLIDDSIEGKALFLKPRNGVGSRGAQVVSPDKLKEFVEKEPQNWIIQEICHGPEVTIDGFFDPETKKCFAVCRERIEIKAGVSTKCRIFFDEALLKLTERIAEILSLSGSFCFQVMKNVGGWAVTDVNPRPGGGTSMSFASGNDFFAASFALIWKEDYSSFFRELENEIFVTRQFSDFVMVG